MLLPVPIFATKVKVTVSSQCGSWLRNGRGQMIMFRHETGVKDMWILGEIAVGRIIRIRSINPRHLLTCPARATAYWGNSSKHGISFDFFIIAGTETMDGFCSNAWADRSSVLDEWYNQVLHGYHICNAFQHGLSYLGMHAGTRKEAAHWLTHSQTNRGSLTKTSEYHQSSQLQPQILTLKQYYLFKIFKARIAYRVLCTFWECQPSYIVSTRCCNPASTGGFVSELFFFGFRAVRCSIRCCLPHHTRHIYTWLIRVLLLRKLNGGRP
jgi:hypothetical protein